MEGARKNARLILRIGRLTPARLYLQEKKNWFGQGVRTYHVQRNNYYLALNIRAWVTIVFFLLERGIDCNSAVYSTGKEALLLHIYEKEGLQTTLTEKYIFSEWWV